MKKLIIVRHGAYDFSSERINNYGKAQMCFLAENIDFEADMPHLETSAVQIITSSAPRAVDSAETIAGELGISLADIWKDPALWSDTEHPQDDETALDLIDQYASNPDTDVLIVVTHLEYARDLPEIFCSNVLNMHVQRTELEIGQSIIIDCEKKTTTIIP